MEIERKTNLLNDCYERFVTDNIRNNMKRNDIIQELSNFFHVKELVCQHTYDRFGEASWQFLDTDWMHCLLIIRRDILKAPMTCNNGSNFTQRGLRCNVCELVKSKTKTYLSAHILGKAGDFSVKGMTAEQARKKIKQSADLLPCNIRIEGGVTWLHFDTMQQWKVDEQVCEFYV